MRKQEESGNADLLQYARDNFVSFLELIDENYEAKWFHEEIGNKLQECFHKLEKGISSRLIIEMPPQHGKSHEATINFPAFALGHHPEWPIITASYTSDLAVKFGYKTRQIMDTPVYKALFKTRIVEDSRAKGNWLTKEGGGYMSRGIGGSTTGSGFKIGIIDDPFKDRQEAESSLMRDRVWEWYTSVFMTRQQGPTMIVVTNTRWHLDDLVARIEKLEASGGEEWEYLTFKAIAEEDEPHRAKGEALWPERFPLSFLEEARKRSVYDFQSLYQQHPISSDSQEFKEDWFRRWEPHEIRGKQFEYYTTVDPAISDKQSADNSVVLTVGKERGSPYIYRIEETIAKNNPLALIDAIFMHWEKYRSHVWLETIAYQKSLKYFILEEQRKRQMYFTVNELKNNKTKSKSIRIRGLIPLYGTSVILHMPNDQEYENELLNFPFGEHDDRIDAMASTLEAMASAHTQYEDGNADSRYTIKTFDPYARK